MKRLVIGDIHGCARELHDLIAAAGIGPGDEVISVGDMLDRGPGDAAVLAFFKEHRGARAIMGNHELKHLGWREGRVKPALSQRISRRILGDTDWNRYLDWFETLPTYIELPEALIVHGFFEPGKAPSEQQQRVLCGTMSGQKRMAPYGEPWYASYDGEKPIIVGHLLYGGAHPAIVPGRFYGLDTGCCHGQRLTGLLLPDFEIVSVPAHEDHWEVLRRRHADLRFSHLDPELLTWEKAEDTLDALLCQADPHAHAAADRFAACLDEGRLNAEALLSRIEKLHAAAEAQITDAQRADRRAYARAYTAAIGDTPLAELLHQRRTRGLDLATLRGRYRKPSQLSAFVASVGGISFAG